MDEEQKFAFMSIASIVPFPAITLHAFAHGMPFS